MKIVCISDTHGSHWEFDRILEGDVLVHSGDFTGSGVLAQVKDFNDWLGHQKFKHKLVIAGNHDWWLYKHKDDIEKIQSVLSNATYLQDSGVEIDGIKFWGSPWQPEFMNWAFNVPRGNRLRAIWEKIPTDTKVLITHGPPYGILDKTLEGDVTGCEDLLHEMKRIKPDIHIFGHIHEGYGKWVTNKTIHINASTLDRSYDFTNAPQIVEIGCEPVKNT